MTEKVGLGRKQQQALRKISQGKIMGKGLVKQNHIGTIWYI